jgi:hypothetical protein
MMQEQYANLVRLTDAAYQSRLARMQRLMADETALRQELASLEVARRNNLAVEFSPADMRAIGADILWEGWIVRQRTALNIRLANLLVQKEAMRVDIREVFGRAQVAKALNDAQLEKLRKTRNA